MKAISANNAIHIHYVPTPTSLGTVQSKVDYIKQGIQRVLTQFQQLFNLLINDINRPRYILVQVNIFIKFHNFYSSVN